MAGLLPANGGCWPVVDASRRLLLEQILTVEIAGTRRVFTILWPVLLSQIRIDLL